MKKIIFGGIAVLAITAAIALNVNLDIQSKNASILQLANIEALAAEGGTSHTLSCGSSGIKMCEATCGIHQVTMKNYGDGKSSTFTCP